MLPKFCRKLLADRSGATAIMIAVMAAALIGFTSLGVEVVQALETQRNMQAVADSAALSAANAQIIGSPSLYTDEGFALAANAGYSSGQTTACVTTSPQVYVGTVCPGDPAASLAACTASGARCVEVKIEAPFTLQLAHVVFPGNFTLHGRAVAVIPPNQTNPDCSEALLPNNSSGTLNGLTVNGNFTVNYLNCSVSVNANAHKNGSSGTFCATDLYVGGTITNSGNGGFTTSTTCGTGAGTQCTTSTPTASCVPGAPPALNPWADNPTLTCSGGGITGSLATPGCYTGNQLNKTLNLCPGVYVVSGSGISLTGGNKTLTSVAGSFAGCPAATASLPAGVTIYMTGTGTVSINGNAGLNLTAQTAAALESEGYSSTVSQDYAGVLFYSTSNSSGGSSFGGNTAVNVTGVIVMPDQPVSFFGNPVATGFQCSEIIASTITFSGASTLAANCAGFNSNNPKQPQQPAYLVE